MEISVIEPGVRIRDVICPQCKRAFRLKWETWSGTFPLTLHLRGCPSGGIYDVTIECPHCKYTEEV